MVCENIKVMKVTIRDDSNQSNCFNLFSYLLYNYFKMKRILIPTDFSDNAKDALSYALEFIAKELSVLHIVHVVQPVLIANSESAIVDNVAMRVLQDQAESTMQVLKLFSKEYFAKENIYNIEIITKVITGTVADEIKKEAADSNVDLVIMGTQGNNHNLIQKVLGTISTKVLNNAPCPIILIPKDYSYRTIDNVIFSTNLDHSDPYELNRALKIIGPHSPLVRVLFVRKPKEKKYNTSIEEFAKYMVDHSPSTRTIFNIETGTNVELLLAEYADRYDAEMVVMHKSKKSLLARIFGVSHTKSMVNRLDVPLMVTN